MLAEHSQSPGLTREEMPTDVVDGCMGEAVRRAPLGCVEVPVASAWFPGGACAMVLFCPPEGGGDTSPGEARRLSRGRIHPVRLWLGLALLRQA
jgi:hypothetical protein